MVKIHLFFYSKLHSAPTPQAHLGICPDCPRIKAGLRVAPNVKGWSPDLPVSYNPYHLPCLLSCSIGQRRMKTDRISE